MTTIQRRACLALRGLAFGKFGPRRLAVALVEQAESERWEAIELTAKQLGRLAKTVRKYRRQIWAQRVLADSMFVPTQEEPCQQRKKNQARPRPFKGVNEPCS